MFKGERDQAREHADAADARAEKCNAARAAAVEEAQAQLTKVAALEAAVGAAHDAKRLSEDRLQRQSDSLKTHAEYAEVSRMHACNRPCISPLVSPHPSPPLPHLASPLPRVTQTRCREAERRRDALIGALDGERSEAMRAKSALARAEEKIMEEQVPRTLIVEYRLPHLSFCIPF